MKKFLEKDRELTNLIGSIFSDQLMEEIYSNLCKFDRAVIWCTYPELTLEEVEIIEEMMVRDYSAEEILEAMDLEDRSTIMQEVINTLCEIDSDRWEEYFTERTIQVIDSNFYDKYMETKGNVYNIRSMKNGAIFNGRQSKTWEDFHKWDDSRY